MSYFKIIFESLAECLSVVTGKTFEVINLNDYVHIDEYDDMVEEYESHLYEIDLGWWKLYCENAATKRSLSVESRQNTIASFALVLSLAINIVLVVYLFG